MFAIFVVIIVLVLAVAALGWIQSESEKLQVSGREVVAEIESLQSFQQIAAEQILIFAQAAASFSSYEQALNRANLQALADAFSASQPGEKMINVMTTQFKIPESKVFEMLKLQLENASQLGAQFMSRLDKYHHAKNKFIAIREAGNLAYIPIPLPYKNLELLSFEQEKLVPDATLTKISYKLLP